MDRNKDKMRSINKTMINRLVAQNKEAELHKMEKVSSNVSKQIDKYSEIFVLMMSFMFTLALILKQMWKKTFGMQLFELLIFTMFVLI